MTEMAEHARGYYWDFPSGSNGKEHACNAGDPVHPWVGKILVGKKRMPCPLQYFCLDIFPMDRAAWRAIVPGAAKSQRQLSD